MPLETVKLGLQSPDETAYRILSKRPPEQCWNFVEFFLVGRTIVPPIFECELVSQKKIVLFGSVPTWVGKLAFIARTEKTIEFSRIKNGNRHVAPAA